MSNQISEEEKVKAVLAEILEATFKIAMNDAMKDLRSRYDEIMCQVNKLGELEKRVVELEKILIVNRLNLN